MKRTAHFILKGINTLPLAAIVFMLFAFAQPVRAQDAFMGYDYVTGTYPLAWTIEQTTFNAGTSKEIIYTMSGGALYTATTAGTSNINGYQINANAAFVEMQLTANSTTSTITDIAFTGSTNNNTAAGDAGIVFSDQYPFNETSVISATAVIFPAATGSWIVLNPTIPEGAKSMRIYRRIYYNSATSTISTSSGTGFVQFGTGTTIRLASLAVTLSVSGTAPTVTTTAVSDITQTTASSGGNVTDEGTAQVTVRGVCWSTSENPTILDSKTEDGSGTGSFISSITGLAAGTTYYVRAYATSTVGTSYGNQETFNTLAGVADIVLSSVNPAVPGGNIIAGNQKNPVYKFNLDVTVSGTQLNQVDFSTAGTYTSLDISKLQLWFNIADNFGSAVQIGTDITSVSGGVSNLSFGSLTQDINAGETGYLWITADVFENPTAGNNLSIDAVNTAGLTFSSGNKSGTAFSGGLQTIVEAGNPDVYFRTKSTGDWNVTSTWETSADSVVWEDATLTPNNTSKYIHVRAPHTVTVTATDSVDQVIVDDGAAIIVNGSPVVFTIVESDADIGMLVNGLLKSTGTANVSPGPHTVNAEGVLSFGSTGVYEHEQNAGAIPVSVWGAGSTVKITGTTNTAPANRNQDYHHLIFDTPDNISNLNMGFNNNIIGGDLTIVNSGTGRWQLCGPTAGTSATLDIMGDVIHLNGNFASHGTGNANTTIIVNHYGNITATNGNFSIARGSQAGTGTTDWFMHSGSITMSDVTTQNSNPAGARFVFTGNTIQNLTLTNMTYGGGGLPLGVDTDAEVNLGSSVIGGSGFFTVNDFGGINTTMPNGFDDNLLTTGAITLSSSGNYGYNGTAAQVTGILLPASVNTLTINNPAGVTLSENVSASTLNLIEGKLNTGTANLLTVTGTSTTSILGGSETDYVNGPLALTLPYPLTAGSVYNFPIGKGSYKPLALVDPVTSVAGPVVILSEVFDENSGGTPGTGLTSLNTNRYWSAEIVSGESEFVSTRLQLTEDGLTSTSGIGKSSTLTGAYDLISSADPVSGTITSDDITSLSFLAIGETGSVSTIQLTVNIEDGWNMVSVPGLHPVDQNVDTWWVDRNPAANVFKFDGGYVSVTNAAPGEGYWMLHVGNRTYNTGDEWPAGGIEIVPNVPLNGNTGWNLIGGYDLTVGTSGITTDPSGLQQGSVFGYTASGGYSTAADLVPGYAYWVLLSGPGQIIIPSSLAKAPAAVTELTKEVWGRIVITDNAGKRYILYGVSGEVNLNNYLLPPAPPAGMFDVRYGSGRYAEDIGSEQMIEMSGIEYPLTVRVENMSIRVQDETGKIVNAVVKSGEEVVISNGQVGKLKVSGNTIPDVYALEQNYPNPFNPSTTIEFSIPEDVENVKLTIYDALGQRVAELVNSKMEAGRYSYHWDASKVASGLYIYQLQTNKFSSTKKMLLLK